MQRKAMTLEAAVGCLGFALIRAARRRGRPNAFSAEELAAAFAGPPPDLADRIGQHYLRSLHGALAQERWPFLPSYRDGRFHVP